MPARGERPAPLPDTLHDLAVAVPSHARTKAEALLAQLALGMAADAAPLARRIERARAARAPAAEWERIAAAVARSIAQRRGARRAPAGDRLSAGAAGRERAPTKSRASIRDHPVVIVCGETGSGKTTQLPKICIAAGRGERGLIGHTQPRRIAARAVATRIAQELGTEIGDGRRLQGALHRPHEARRLRQADDRRHPARRNAGRSAACRLRHDHRRRGARAQPQHRFPAGLPEAAPRPAARSQGDHHVGDARRRALRAALRHRRQRRRR